MTPLSLLAGRTVLLKFSFFADIRPGAVKLYDGLDNNRCTQKYQRMSRAIHATQGSGCHRGLPRMEFDSRKIDNAFISTGTNSKNRLLGLQSTFVHRYCVALNLLSK